MIKLKELYKYIYDNLNKSYSKNEIKSYYYIIIDYLNIEFKKIIIDPNDFITSNQFNKISKIINKLKKNWPIQYILGYSYFHGYKFTVNNNVLIPRPETEELVDIIIKENKTQRNILDLGSGSGCIGITLNLKLKSKVTCIDISEKSIEVAKLNAKNLNADIKFIQKNILSNEIFSISNKYDIIVSNPPYIPKSYRSKLDKNVKNFEPNIALFVDDKDPMIFCKKIIEISKKLLNKNGKIYMEINDGYIQNVLNLDDNKFKKFDLRKDFRNNYRFLIIEI